jgi:hypothetical protein
MVDWFTRGHDVRDEPERVDEYLALPGCETTGVKLREGRLEVKARTAGPVAMALPGGHGGRREGWVKWSLAADEGGALRQSVDASGDEWVRVGKRRRLRKLATGARGVLEVDPADADLPAGCQVELAALRVLGPARRSPVDGPPERPAGEPWWSLSFESFGETARLDDQLEPATAAVLGRPPPVTLSLARSLSYPAWLARRILR